MPGKWTNDMQDFWLIIYTVPSYHVGCRGCSWWDWFTCTLLQNCTSAATTFCNCFFSYLEKITIYISIRHVIQKEVCFFLNMVSFLLGWGWGGWIIMYLTHALFAICNLLWYCTQYFKTFNTLKSCLIREEVSYNHIFHDMFSTEKSRC